MKFRSTPRLALRLPDLKKAESFYTGVLGFRLISRTSSELEYDTGRLILCISQADATSGPALSFTVINALQARAYLEENGCEIVEQRDGSLRVKDPFGIHYQVTTD